MPGERLPQYANDFNKSDLFQVFIAAQDKINRELHVATLCTVESQIDARTFRCMAFPKPKGRDAAMFNAICIRASEGARIANALAKGEKLIALAIMTDYNSEANYSYIQQKQKAESIDTESAKHSLNNAIIAYVGDAVSGTSYEEATEELT